MSSHSAPFTSLRAMPGDLATGLWLVVFALAGMAWDEVRRWHLVRRT